MSGALLWLRRLLRNFIPYEVRLRYIVLRRTLRDRFSDVRFATERGSLTSGGVRWGVYTLPVVIPPGQEIWGEAKVGNLRRMAAALDGMVIAPGETLSVWKLAGRPTRARGYGVAAALKDGELVGEVGGATCLLSTVIFNTALVVGLAIDERYEHSVDSYGEARYFELGRDAAIEYGYRDLRFRNDGGAALQLRIRATSDSVSSWIESDEAIEECSVQVSSARPQLSGRPALTIDTYRARGSANPEWIGTSTYLLPEESPLLPAHEKATQWE